MLPVGSLEADFLQFQATGRQHRGCIIPQAVTQSSAPEDGRNHCPKHVELIRIINKPLLLHLVSCLYDLNRWYTVKQIPYSKLYFHIYYLSTCSKIKDEWIKQCRRERRYWREERNKNVSREKETEEGGNIENGQKIWNTVLSSVCNGSTVSRRRYKLLNSLTPLSASTSRFAVSRAEHGCCIHDSAAP